MQRNEKISVYYIVTTFKVNSMDELNPEYKTKISSPKKKFVSFISMNLKNIGKSEMKQFDFSNIENDQRNYYR